MTTQANRQGRPWLRADGRWAARAYPPGSKPKMVYGRTEDEVLAKQADLETQQSMPDLPPENRAHGRDLPKPVRVTLNIPPDLYRQLRKWTDHAADAIGAPQVSQQDALRAMLTAVTLDPSIGVVVIDLLRRDQAR